MPENLQECSHPDLLSSEEERHVPQFFQKAGKIWVRLGGEDGDFPKDQEHYIRYVALVDESGDIFDYKVIGPDFSEDWICFDHPEEIFFIHASCNRHGTWVGMENESLGIHVPIN